MSNYKKGDVVFVNSDIYSSPERTNLSGLATFIQEVHNDDYGVYTVAGHKNEKGVVVSEDDIFRVNEGDVVLIKSRDYTENEYEFASRRGFSYTKEMDDSRGYHGKVHSLQCRYSIGVEVTEGPEKGTIWYFIPQVIKFSEFSSPAERTLEGLLSEFTDEEKDFAMAILRAQLTDAVHHFRSTKNA